MREYLKNDLLEIVKTMRELCDVVLQECERENTSYLLELLEQGQQAAISIGETIEKLEGDRLASKSIEIWRFSIQENVL